MSAERIAGLAAADVGHIHEHIDVTALPPASPAGPADLDPVAAATALPDPSGRQDSILMTGTRHEAAIARQVRARALVAGLQPGDIAAAIASQCGCSKIRACRLALGIALADVVAQVRARYEADGRRAPRFSETLLSAYESGQKRPGPEYLHYLCAVYQADPADLGFDGRCLCGRPHRPDRRPVPHQPGLGVAAQVQAPWQPGLGVAAQAQAPWHPGRGQNLGPDVAPAPGDPGPGGPDIRPAAGPTARADQVALRPTAAEVPAVAPRPDHNEDDDELRNMLLRQMADPGGQVDSRFLGAVDRIRRRMDEALLGGTVSTAMIDRWEQGAIGYARQYMAISPLRLLCDVLLDFADVRRMCEERQPLEFAERLCRLASQLAGLAGMAMLDLGDHRLAKSFFRTARTAADETGDRQLRAWVTIRESLVPLYFGDPREAASLASAAGDLAGRHLCVAAVMAPVIEARAQARIVSLSRYGRRVALDRARASLDRAHDALGDLTAEQRADTALGYTERQLYFHMGDILVALGDWQGAHQAFSQAGQLYSNAEVLDRALVGLGGARCLLESDEPDQALAVGRAILAGLPPEHRTEIVLQVARALGHQAAARDASLPGLSSYRAALQGN